MVAPIIMGRGPGFIVKHDSDLVAMAVERDGSTIVVGAAPRAAPVDQVTFDSFGFLFSRGALVGRTVQGVVTWAELPSGKPLMIARLDADGVALVAEPTKVVVHDFGRGANQTLWELPPGATCGTPRVLDAESPPDLLAARKGCALLVCGYSSFLEICGREVQEWSIGIGPFDQYSFDADFTALWSASRSGLNIARDAFSPPPPPLPVNARPESVRPIGRVHCGEGELRDFGGMRGLVVGEDFILETLHEAGHG